MAGGMVGVGRQILREAMSGGMAASRLEHRRVLADEAFEEAQKQQQQQTMTSGAITGALMGPKVASSAKGLYDKFQAGKEFASAMAQGPPIQGPSLVAGEGSLGIMSQAPTGAGSTAALETGISSSPIFGAAQGASTAAPVAGEALTAAAPMAIETATPIATGLGGATPAAAAPAAAAPAVAAPAVAAPAAAAPAAAAPVATGAGITSATSTGTGIASGATAGSAVPVVGTIIGAIAGLIFGKLFS